MIGEESLDIVISALIGKSRNKDLVSLASVFLGLLSGSVFVFTHIIVCIFSIRKNYKTEILI